MTWLPNPEQVAVAWLKRLTDLYTVLVTDASTSLPQSDTWTKPCYLQATLVAEAPDLYSPDRNPYVQVDVWAGPKKWGEVSTVSELIREATFDGSGLGEFTVKTGFFPVSLKEVSVFAGARLDRDDPAALARSTMTLAFVYVINK